MKEKQKENQKGPGSDFSLLRSRAEDGDLAGAGLQRCIEALQIGRQNRVDRSRVPLDALHHGRVVAHLRHPLRRDERRCLDDAQAGIGQPLDQFDLGRGRNDQLLVLQPVARADLDDFDFGGEVHGLGVCWLVEIAQEADMNPNGK